MSPISAGSISLDSTFMNAIRAKEKFVKPGKEN
jgi:hypothetical protein